MPWGFPQLLTNSDDPVQPAIRLTHWLILTSSLRLLSGAVRKSSEFSGCCGYVQMHDLASFGIECRSLSNLPVRFS
jgi:hypothetical protein